MTGPEHYREAEELLHLAAVTGVDRTEHAQEYLAAARVHATLALAAATALSLSAGMYVPDAAAWERVASAHARESVPS